jgi:hypothetical protein
VCATDHLGAGSYKLHILKKNLIGNAEQCSQERPDYFFAFFKFW